MTGSSGNTCIKYLVFIFNLIFFAVGIALLGVGIYAKVGKNNYIDVTEELTTAEHVTVGNLMIAVGVIITIVAFLGCCGATKEIRAMLLAFFILLFIIFILELAIGILAVVKRDDFEEGLKKEFKNAIKNKYESKEDSPVRIVIDKFQRDFDCCGYESWLDWKGSDYYNKTEIVPKSCCINEEDAKCGVADPNPKPELYYKKGCFKEVTNWFKDNAIAAAACGFAFAIVQVLGLVFSMLLYRSIASSETIA